MSKITKYLTGEKYGRLTVLSEAEGRVQPSGWKRRRVNCICDCGKEKVVRAAHLGSGSTTSCGCYNIERLKERSITHGLRDHRLYKIWGSMKARCYNENAKNYHRYGGRKISICDEWRYDFKVFYDWSMANGYAEDLSIDRKENNGNYTPDNCRWVTMQVQCNNMSNNVMVTHQGTTDTLANTLRRLDLFHKYKKIAQRIYNGKTFKQSIKNL